MPRRERQQQQPVPSESPLQRAWAYVIAAMFIVAIAAIAGFAVKGRGRPFTTSEQSDFSGDARISAHASVGLVKHFAAAGGHALQAQAAIAENTTLLIVPSVLIMDAVRVFSVPDLGTALRDANDAVLAALTDTRRQEQDAAIVRVVLWLLHEKARGTSSPWAQWLLDIVPAYDELLVDVSWDPVVVRRCLTPHQQQRWEASSVALLSRIIRGVRAAAAASPAIANLVGVSFASRAGQSAVQWALAVLQSRAWLRPAPHFYTLIPYADLTDPRAATHAVDPDGVSPHAPLADRFKSQQAAVARRLASLARGGPNVALVLDAPQGNGSDGSASLVAVRNISHGEYLHVVLPSGALLASQAPWRFGFSTEAALSSGVVDSYVTAETLPSKGGQQLPSSCLVGQLLAFDGVTGVPSAQLRLCLDEFFGAGDRRAASAFIATHAATVVEKIHTLEVQQRCINAATDAPSTQKQLVASMLASSEQALRQAFLKLKTHAEANL